MQRDLLIVHGHRMFREALRGLISGRTDLRVIAEASDGVSAVTLATRLRPDIVILESTLTGLNSVETTRRIVDAVDGVRVVVVARTEGALAAQRMISAGAIAYLTKDAGASELMRAIDAAVAGETYVDTNLESSMLEISASSSTRHELTDRQREVLQLMADGKSTRDIAGDLDLSAKTIEAHRKNIMEKLKLYTVAELTKYAIREGITSTDA